MWFSSWLRNRTVSRKHHPASRFRPSLEVLEDRAVPATLTVNTTLDVLGHANGMLSLRQAILDANAAPRPDTIVVPAGTYTLTRAGINEDAGLTGDLDLTGKVTIKGAGASATVVNAAGLDRVFHVHSNSQATLSGLTIEGGAVSPLDQFPDQFQGFANALLPGGGILNEGTLTVRDCTLSGNSTPEVDLRSGGYITGVGGGIANLGTLTISNSTLSGNSAGDWGGGIENYDGSMTVSNCIVSGNFSYLGGGIDNEWTMTVRDSTLSGNSAVGGGGIQNIGALTISNTTLSTNSAIGGGGGIFNIGALTISNSILSGNSAYEGGGIANFGMVTIRNSTLSDNSAVYSVGGGIDNESGTLTVRNSTFSGNSAAFGGGIYSYSFSPLPVTITNCTFSGNTATQAGGGIYNVGWLRASDSKIIGNSAPVGGDVYNFGGVFFDCIIGDQYP